jgi:hypothetical protein
LATPAYIIHKWAATSRWSDALNDLDFADRVLILHVCGIPDLAASALEILGELEHCKGVAALDLDADEVGIFCIEFAMLVQLGFFVCVDGSYRMAVPETVTLEKVKQAALGIISTTDDAGHGLDVIQPELLLRTLSKTQAQERRYRLIELRNFSDRSPYDRKLQ